MNTYEWVVVKKSLQSNPALSQGWFACMRNEVKNTGNYIFTTELNGLVADLCSWQNLVWGFSYY